MSAFEGTFLAHGKVMGREGRYWVSVTVPSIISSVTLAEAQLEDSDDGDGDSGDCGDGSRW